MILSDVDIRKELASERVRYAEADLAPATVQTAVVRARELLERLDSSEADTAEGRASA